MKLGIYLALGDSFRNMSKTGQDDRFLAYYLKNYSRNFSEVVMFSYQNEKPKNLPKNVKVIPNRFNLHRYIYGFLLPVLNFKEVNGCDIIRVFHLSGTVPAIVTKFVFGKKFVFNYAYDYIKFSEIEGKYFQSLLFSLLNPFAIFLASKIFAANKSIYKSLPKSKSVYLPNGVDISLFKPKRLKRLPKLPVVLSVGRLERQKNFKILVSAMEKVEAYLVIVGIGSQESTLISQAKKQQIQLKLVSKVAHTKMPVIYNQASVFVLPSMAEGSPKALFEAMSCALPVIVNKEAVNEGIIENNVNGILVDPSVFKIREQITKVLDNFKLANRLSKNARQTISQNYNFKKLINQEIQELKKPTS